MLKFAAYFTDIDHLLEYKCGCEMLTFLCTGWINTLRQRQNGRHFPDDIFKWIFLNENVWISINISLKFVPRGPINNIPTLVQVMAWRRPGDKPLSEPMMVRLPTHICVTHPQWVNAWFCNVLYRKISMLQFLPLAYTETKTTGPNLLN